jgi:hypothetical protein
MDDTATRYWDEADYRRGILGNRPEEISAGLAQGVLDVLLEKGGQYVFWRAISGNDCSGYHQAIDPQAIAAHWLAQASEQRELAEAMKQAGASGFVFRFRKHTDYVAREVRALRRATRALTGVLTDEIESFE